MKVEKASGANAPLADEESYWYDAESGTLTLWVYHASEIAAITSDAVVYSMFEKVNVVIISDIVENGDTILEDKASRTTAVIPAAAVEKGIVKAGQRIYLVITTTLDAYDRATYDISLRDANGNAFAWTEDACPSVTYYAGDFGSLAKLCLTITDEANGLELPYGKDASPGWYYDEETQLLTIRTTSFS